MKMKKTFQLLMLLAISQFLYSQNKNQLAISYGATSGAIIYRPGIVGTGSYDMIGSDMFEISYKREITEKFAIRGGLSYSINKFEITAAPTGIETPSWQEEVQIISVPIYANLNFAKYFFVEGGLITDFEINLIDYRAIDNQTGLGFSLGGGFQYPYKNWGVFVNPFLNFHSLIPFYKANYRGHLAEAGIKFGMFYCF
ncbi:MAG: hypothetical protein B6I20_08290 [Bacteroidetes bacterium 4572_117]|nr:MAG: hypothetical protein B6I20_08290 [Bacteroidetes bacterium 4572_117]